MKKILLFILFIIALTTMSVGVYFMFNGPRMRNQPAIKNYQAQMPVTPANSIPANFAKEKSFQTINLEPNSQNLKIGKIAYNYYCAFCHGDDGKGQGQVGQSYTPVPTDLHDSKIQKYSDSELVNAILRGKGHEPAMNNIIENEYFPYMILYVRYFTNQSKQ
jgi:mono/diheme cytochrome c family protein